MLQKLTKYKAELDRVHERLIDSPEDDKILALKAKLEKIVALLEEQQSELKAKEDVPDFARSLAAGSSVQVLHEGRWWSGQVSSNCSPSYILVLVQELGKTIRLENFKYLRCVPTAKPFSNPSLANTLLLKHSASSLAKTGKANKGNTVRKEREAEHEKAANERQQSWKDFSNKKLKR